MDPWTDSDFDLPTEAATSVEDFLGRRIYVGSKIVYAAASGRTSILVHAEVLEVRPNSEKGKAKLVVKPLKRLYGGYGNKTAVPLAFPERCAVIG